MYMLQVKSRVLYEQMKGRGGRVCKATELLQVSQDAKTKTHFVLIDCVGLSEHDMDDTRPLEKSPGVSFDKLLDHVASGGTNPELLSSLASRLSRLELKLDARDHARIKETCGQNGQQVHLPAITHGLVEALNVDRQIEHARTKFGLSNAAEPSDAQIAAAAKELLAAAAKPLAANPKLRNLLRELKSVHDQLIDEISKDELLEAGPAPEAKERAQALVKSFEAYIAGHKDEIEALQFFYAQPYKRRLKYDDIRALANAIGTPPRNWTPERLWHAYEQLDKARVRGASSERLLTDILSLIRFALHQQPELTPYAEQIHARFANWLAQQTTSGRAFTDEQLHWLTMMRDHVVQSLEVEISDFDLTPFVEQGGLGRAAQVFGKNLAAIVREVNEVLAA
jgi:type I restriction enzyme R subunit